MSECDSKYINIHEPELWADIEPPEGYHGKLMIQAEDSNRKMDIDGFEMFYPEEYAQYLKGVRSFWQKLSKKAYRYQKNSTKSTK